jgi:hypothetical protein
MMRAFGLGLLVACAACASASVGTGDGDAGVGDDGATVGDGKVQTDAQRDGQKDGPLQDDAAVQEDALVQQDALACVVDGYEGFGNNNCVEAVTKGNLSDSAPSHVSIVANLWPAGDVDWYRVAFVDTPETAGVCDKLNIRIAFAQNPGDRYLFDVSADNCTETPTCGTGEQPTGLTTFSYSDDFACPCVEPANPPATTDTTHICVDHSMVLRIRVYRVVGAPVLCENYELSIDNG